MKDLEIKLTENKGRGVFTKEPIEKGEIIESCEVIKIPFDQSKKIDKTELFNYYFSFSEENIAIALGKGSLYNHSYNPNAKYVKDIENDKIIFVALKKIFPKEEITVNYNENPKDKTKVWFEK